MSLRPECVKRMHLLEHPVRRFSAAKDIVLTNILVCDLISIKRTNIRPFCRTGVAKPLSLPDHTSPLAFTDKSFGTASRALIDLPPSLQAAVAARYISEIVLNMICIETLGLVHPDTFIVNGGGRNHESARKRSCKRIEEARSADHVTKPPGPLPEAVLYERYGQ